MFHYFLIESGKDWQLEWRKGYLQAADLQDEGEE